VHPRYVDSTLVFSLSSHRYSFLRLFFSIHNKQHVHVFSLIQGSVNRKWPHPTRNVSNLRQISRQRTQTVTRSNLQQERPRVQRTTSTLKRWRSTSLLTHTYTHVYRSTPRNHPYGIPFDPYQVWINRWDWCIQVYLMTCAKPHPHCPHGSRKVEGLKWRGHRKDGGDHHWCGSSSSISMNLCKSL
jgi:hypothetical protein